MGDIVLKVDGITKQYGKKLVLNNVNMTIHKGDVYGFVGRNGAGKTTLIRIIMGLSNQNVGSFELNLEKRKGVLSAIIEGPAFQDNLSAEDNLIHHSIMLGLENADQKITEVLELVGLQKDKKAVKNYSLGMKQRLGIALALLSDPEFLMLDEPINGLDPTGIQEFRNIISKLNTEKGMTILISSHILSELDKVATTFGFIDNGIMLKEISAEELHEITKKSYRYTVSTTEGIKDVMLEKFGIGQVSIEGNHAFTIKEHIDLTDLILALNEKGIRVVDKSEFSNDLETYFTDLLRGGQK